MNPEAYLEMAETESRHWWFCGRRAILSQMIASIKLPHPAAILELGCGTGGNLDMLAQFGSVSALEMDANARAIAQQKTAGRYAIRENYCPDNIPFAPNSFDMVGMFDVLEHIDDDVATLQAIKPLLKANGRILITVPAYQWLYGAHDEFLHHKRRYSARHLKRVVEDAGLRSVKLSYFNSLLFPLAVLVRLKDKLTGNKSMTGTSVPPSAINCLFEWAFGAERYLLPHFRLPFGVSLICILEAVDEC